MMKKTIAWLTAALLLLGCLTGCGGQPESSSPASAEGSAPSSQASTAPEASAPAAPTSSPEASGSGGSSSTSSSAPASSTPTASTPSSTPSTSSTPSSEPAPFAFTAVTYPAEAVKTLAARGMTEADFIRRAGAATYDGNAGYAGSGIIVSPHFTAAVSGQTVPVYGTLTYIGTTGRGAIHSYSTITVNRDSFSLTVELTASGFTPNKAVVLPVSLGVTPRVQGGKTTATITACGTYTFLFNDGDQEHAYTLFVRKQVDEAAEIRAYQEQYGSSKVKVYEPGVHYVDYLSLPSDSFTIYLKAGALLIANHKYDLNSEDDRNANKESGSNFGNRYAVISAANRTNVRVVGQGTIDLTPLDWHERNGIVFTNCRQVTIQGITLVNCPEWSLLQYRCTDVTIDQVAVFGYKTNSDGIAVANSQQVRVTNCFARSGDDLFEVKTLGGPTTAVCRDVVFDNCIAWNGKARCFGITGEVNLDISDVTFRNSAIIYRDATWDNDRIGGLVIIPEQGGGKIQNITFENIEIYRDTGRAINVTIYGSGVTDCTIENVVFRNITYSSGLPAQLKSGSGAGNRISVSFENVVAGGTRLTTANSAAYLLTDERSSFTAS